MNESTTKKFDFRFSPSGYALIYLDDVSGTVTMKTDWGDYTYAWPSPGRGSCTLLEFLCGRDYGYLLNKFCRQTYFDAEYVRREFKKMVVERRRDWSLSADEARDAWSEIEDSDFGTTDQMYLTIENQMPVFVEKILMNEIYELPRGMDYRPCDVGFFKEVFPQIQKRMLGSV